MRKLLILLISSITLNAYADLEVIENSPLCKSILSVIGTSPANVIDNIGTPTNKEENKIKNPHDPELIDKEITLYYSEGYVAFYYASYNDRYILLKAKLNQHYFGKHLNKVIPNNLNDVIIKYGKPKEKSNIFVKYYCTFEANESVNIYHTNNLVEGIEFFGYVD